MELAELFMRRIASPWSRAFNGISIDIHDDAVSEVNKLLVEYMESATPLLKEAVREEVDQVRNDLQGHLDTIATRVKDILNEKRKGANRCLAPHIKKALLVGYNSAAPLSGAGSAALRKVCCIRSHYTYMPGIDIIAQEKFREHLTKKKDEMFLGATDAIFDSLDFLSEAVEKSLSSELDELSKTVSPCIP